MNTNYQEIAEKLKAVAHPVRLQIVTGLIKDKCNVSKIQQSLGLPQSTISQHLKILKSAGIIEGKREGTKICYQVLNKWIKKVIKAAERK